MGVPICMDMGMGMYTYMWAPGKKKNFLPEEIQCLFIAYVRQLHLYFAAQAYIKASLSSSWSNISGKQKPHEY